MHTANKDFVLRVSGIGLKFLALLLIIKIDKNIVPLYFFYSTFAAFLYKLTVLSELNNYRRLTNEVHYINICIFYFFNCLHRILLFLVTIYFFTFFLKINLNFVAVFCYIMSIFITTYLAACFVINSNQSDAAVVNFIGSISLFCAVVIAFLIDDNILNNIFIISFIFNFFILLIKFKWPKDFILFNKKSLGRLKTYLIKKNYNLRFFDQLQRGFVSLSNYSIITLVAFGISKYEYISIDLKNTLIVLLFLSNIVNLYLITNHIFPYVTEITKGKFKIMSFKKIITFIFLVIFLYLITTFVLFKYFNLITVFYSVLIYIFLTYLISFQGFYIEARTIKLDYILYLLLALFINLLLLYINYNNFIFIPILLILPRLSLFTINKICFNKF
jgi:hypothetical protein